MRNTRIPAQITTVEDKIAGNLTLTQLVILASPVFVDFLIYAAAPKGLKISLLKIAIMLLVSPLLACLSIRFKGQLIIFWIISISRYRLRSKVYVFNKNTLYMRSVIEEPSEPIEHELSSPKAASRKREIGSHEVSAKLDASKTSLKLIKEKKGRLYVYVTSTK